MHMALLPNDRIIAFDRSHFGPSNVTLPQGKCIKGGELETSDCYAHAVEFDPITRKVRPLTIQTDGALLVHCWLMGSWFKPVATG